MALEKKTDSYYGLRDSMASADHWTASCEDGAEFGTESLSATAGGSKWITVKSKVDALQKMLDSSTVDKTVKEKVQKNLDLIDASVGLINEQPSADVDKKRRLSLPVIVKTVSALTIAQAEARESAGEAKAKAQRKLQMIVKTVGALTIAQAEARKSVEAAKAEAEKKEKEAKDKAKKARIALEKAEEAAEKKAKDEQEAEKKAKAKTSEVAERKEAKAKWLVMPADFDCKYCWWTASQCKKTMLAAAMFRAESQPEITNSCKNECCKFEKQASIASAEAPVLPAQIPPVEEPVLSKQEKKVEREEVAVAEAKKDVEEAKEAEKKGTAKTLVMPADFDCKYCWWTDSQCKKTMFAAAMFRAESQPELTNSCKNECCKTEKQTSIASAEAPVLPAQIPPVEEPVLSKQEKKVQREEVAVAEAKKDVEEVNEEVQAIDDFDFDAENAIQVDIIDISGPTVTQTTESLVSFVVLDPGTDQTCKRLKVTSHPLYKDTKCKEIDDPDDCKKTVMKVGAVDFNDYSMAKRTQDVPRGCFLRNMYEKQTLKKVSHGGFSSSGNDRPPKGISGKRNVEENLICGCYGTLQSADAMSDKAIMDL